MIKRVTVCVIWLSNEREAKILINLFRLLSRIERRTCDFLRESSYKINREFPELRLDMSESESRDDIWNLGDFGAQLISHSSFTLSSEIPLNK